MTLSDAPGLGIEPDLKRLARFVIRVPLRSFTADLKRGAVAPRRSNRRDYIQRRYCPPTSNSAFVI